VTAEIKLLIFGLGYSGIALAEHAVQTGLFVTIVSRNPCATPPPGVGLIGFDSAGAALAGATHLVATAAPDAHGDPVLARWGSAIVQAPLHWLGYLSTTGVYGDRDGAWVDEASSAAPSSDRGKRRLMAEQAWCHAGKGRAVDLFRLAGIYGPGRSAIDDLRDGRARRVSKPGHLFGRVHRDDIAGALLAAILQTVPPGVRVLNLTDDEPAASADVVAEAARLLGVEPPLAIPFEQAAQTMSPMGLSLWADDRKVSSAATQRILGRRWLYPTYREGLRAVLQQTAQRGA
jgi:nucleoside-diphosphate-sugar epimerase